MQTDSYPIIKHVLEGLMFKVWEGIAVQNIKKMAPFSARLQALEAAHSHIKNQMENKVTSILFSEQIEANPIPLDTFTVNGAQVQSNNLKSISKARRLSVASSAIRSQKRQTNNSFFSKKSISQAQSKIIQGHQQQFFKLPEPNETHQVFNPKQDDLRQKKFMYERQEMKMKQMAEDRIRQKQEMELRSKKMLKDIKKFTYDYAGGYMNVGAFDPGNQKLLKLAPKNAQQTISKKADKKIEPSNIQNQKSKERETRSKLKAAQKANDKNRPQFNENRPQSLIDGFEDNSKISEGVKLRSQKGASQLTMQRPLKLTGMKKYRFSEYQNMIRDKKFKEFSLNSHSSAQILNNTLDSHPLISKTTPIPIQKPAQSNLPSHRHKSKTKSQISFKQEKVMDEGALPPIKSQHDKYLLKRSFKNHHPKSHSNRTINVSGLSSRMTLKSKQKITIDNEQDFRFMLNN